MLVVLARGGDGRGGGGGEGGVGVLDIDLPIFSPDQALKPVPLLRKANSR